MQNAANAKLQMTPNVCQSSAELRPNSHMLPSRTEPNIRPNSSAELRRTPNFGPSLSHTDDGTCWLNLWLSPSPQAKPHRSGPPAEHWRTVNSHMSIVSSVAKLWSNATLCILVHWSESDLPIEFLCNLWSLKKFNICTCQYTTADEGFSQYLLRAEIMHWMWMW